MKNTSKEQKEINRLRKVLHSICDNIPHEHMDIDTLPELTTWICETTEKARIGAYAVGCDETFPYGADDMS